MLNFFFFTCLTQTSNYLFILTKLKCIFHSSCIFSLDRIKPGPATQWVNISSVYSKAVTQAY